MVTIKVPPFGQTLTLSDDGWSSDDNPMLAEHLNAISGGGAGYDPAPLRTEAQRVVDIFGGEIVAYTPPYFDPDVVY